MVGWHQPYEFEQALGVSDEQGSVAVRAQVGKEFPGGLLRLDPAFAYAEPPSS